MTALRTEQKAIDHQIKELIKTDARLKELFEQIVSVPGIGVATATEIIITTNEMQTITDPKKMARATSAAMQA